MPANWVLLGTASPLLSLPTAVEWLGRRACLEQKSETAEVGNPHLQAHSFAHRPYAACPNVTRVNGVTGGLNSTSAALLGLLYDGPLTGGQLVAAADQRLGPLWTLTRSQVYRELPVMAGRGYVRAGKPGPRASVSYTISAAGKRAFTAWLATPLEADHPRNPLLLRLGFGSLHSKSDLRRLVAEAREQHEAMLALHKESVSRLKKTDAEPCTVASAEFGVAYEKALLKWLDTVPT